jgi:hypothetical protein
VEVKGQYQVEILHRFAALQNLDDDDDDVDITRAWKELSGTKRENISKEKLMSLKQTVTANIRDLHRGTVEFKKVYEPNIEKGDNCDLLANSHNMLKRWNNFFCQIFNLHGVSDVRQTERHITEPVVPEPHCFEVEIVIEKLKRYKSPGFDEIPAELIQAGGNTFWDPHT